MFKDGRFVFIGITAISIAGLVVFFHFAREVRTVHKYALSLLLGGALGNLLDRAEKGYVVDFLDFYVGNYHWYIFNIADSAITVAVILLFFDLFIQRKKAG